MIALFGSEVWVRGDNPFQGLRPGRLVIAVDNTRGGSGPDGPIVCYLAGRVQRDERGHCTVKDWSAI